MFSIIYWCCIPSKLFYLHATIRGNECRKPFTDNLKLVARPVLTRVDRPVWLLSVCEVCDCCVFNDDRLNSFNCSSCWRWCVYTATCSNKPGNIFQLHYGNRKYASAMINWHEKCQRFLLLDKIRCSWPATTASPKIERAHFRDHFLCSGYRGRLHSRLTRFEAAGRCLGRTGKNFPKLITVFHPWRRHLVYLSIRLILLIRFESRLTDLMKNVNPFNPVFLRASQISLIPVVVPIEGLVFVYCTLCSVRDTLTLNNAVF